MRSFGVLCRARAKWRGSRRHDDEAAVGQGRAGGADEGAAVGDGGGFGPDRFLDSAFGSARNDSVGTFGSGRERHVAVISTKRSAWRNLHHDPAVRNVQGFGVETAPDVELATRSVSDRLDQRLGQVGNLGPDISANLASIYTRRPHTADQIQVLPVTGPAALFHGHGKLR